MNYPISGMDRRKFLLAATAGAGGLGVAAVSVPFISSMGPSEAAKAAGAAIQVDITAIQPGDLLTVEWRGRPIWVLHRTDSMLESLNDHTQLLADPRSEKLQQPEYAQNLMSSATVN